MNLLWVVIYNNLKIWKLSGKGKEFFLLLYLITFKLFILSLDVSGFWYVGDSFILLFIISGAQITLPWKSGTVLLYTFKEDRMRWDLIYRTWIVIWYDKRPFIDPYKFVILNQIIKVKSIKQSVAICNMKVSFILWFFPLLHCQRLL